MEHMTDEQYVKAQGGRCPYCRSSDIEGDGHIEAEGRSAFQEVKSVARGKRWQDFYVLSGYMGEEE